MNRIFRGSKPFPPLKGRDVIIVDDDIASGFSMLVTIKTIRNLRAKYIIVAVPTTSSHALKLVETNVDKVICPNIRETSFFAVADAYLNWYDLSENDTISLLRKVRIYWYSR